MSYRYIWQTFNQVHMCLDPPFCITGLWSFAFLHRSPVLPGRGLSGDQTLVAVNSLLEIWMLWDCLVRALLLALLIWQCWPALVRKSHCAWCWKRLGIMRWYPRRWSSTICCQHARRIQVQSALRRAQRMRLPMEQAER